MEELTKIDAKTLKHRAEIIDVLLEWRNTPLAWDAILHVGEHDLPLLTEKLLAERLLIRASEYFHFARLCELVARVIVDLKPDARGRVLSNLVMMSTDAKGTMDMIFRPAFELIERWVDEIDLSCELIEALSETLRREGAESFGGKIALMLRYRYQRPTHTSAFALGHPDPAIHPDIRYL